MLVVPKVQMRGLAVGVLGLVLCACNIDPYRLDFDQDATTKDARIRVDSGFVRSDGGGSGRDGGNTGDGDGGTVGCVGEAERCNGIDDDCDDVIDNGFNLQLDPANCGRCGNACDDATANQRGSCVAGECVYACLPGFLDCSPAVAGCEYACIKTNGGQEICDGVDNDCDCQVDEGFATDDDVNNCGRCRNICIALHGTPDCAAGKCVVASCDAGYKDLDPQINGCEYRCPIFPPSTGDATCNGLDDDCDGQVDEDVPGVGTACDTAGLGECKPGKNRCVNGHQQCLPDNGSIPEICDNKDNDCNGEIDNGYDKQNDPNHCGANCATCSFEHAIAGCTAGVCKYVACETGWSDRFPDATNPDKPGCDYECTPSGPEVCDGIDNDCDGLTDIEDPDILRPAPTFCANRGACVGATLACGAPAPGCGDSTVAWRCVYGAGAERDTCGNLLPQETLCDGIDGDCDGANDEAFPQITTPPTPCDDGKLGLCRATGTFICDPADPAKKTTKCQIQTPGGTSSPETCNGKDDDCDGMVDDGATDQVVTIPGHGPTYSIMKYEASHPDATGTAEGNIGDHACSNAGVLPWSLVTWDQARTACMAKGAGWNLCTKDQWMFACAGAGNRPYPYGSPYNGQTCNGNDFDGVSGGSDDDITLPCGSLAGCVSQAGAFDLSGNLREWTSTAVGIYRQIMGGAYDNPQPALTCTFDFWTETPDSYFYNLGFRCCRTN